MAPTLAARAWIKSVNFWRLPRAADVSPGTRAAFRMASYRVSPWAAAWLSSASRVVLPRPRGGTLSTRLTLTESAGLTRILK